MVKKVLKIILFIIIALIVLFGIWGRAPEPAGSIFDSSTESEKDKPNYMPAGYGANDPNGESYMDPDGYYGMIRDGDNRYFLTKNARSLKKANFDKESFSYAWDLRQLDRPGHGGPEWSGTVLDGKIYYTDDLRLWEIDISTGKHEKLYDFKDIFQYIVVCEPFTGDDGCKKILIATVNSPEEFLPPHYYENIYAYNITSGEMEFIAAVSEDFNDANMKYLTSDENYAYFSNYRPVGTIIKMDLKTGEFSYLVKDKLIYSTAGTDRNEHFMLGYKMNCAVTHDGYLYFMISGYPNTVFQLYRANLETGEVEKYEKEGFDGSITAFCIEDGTLYAAVQSEAEGILGYPDYLGTYAVYTIDTETGNFEKITKDIEILSEIRGMTVEGNKALIFGSHPTFVDLER